jgi:DNA invertase Pin-like site-specific DNA recombinase
MSEDSLAGRTGKKRASRGRVITEQRRPLLDKSALEKIRFLASESGVTISAIAERFGVSGTTIRRVISESEVN